MQDITGQEIKPGDFIRTQNPDGPYGEIHHHEGMQLQAVGDGKIHYHLVWNYVGATTNTWGTSGGFKGYHPNEAQTFQVKIVDENELIANGVDPYELRLLPDGFRKYFSASMDFDAANPKDTGLNIDLTQPDPREVAFFNQPMLDVHDTVGIKIGRGDIIESISTVAGSTHKWEVLGSFNVENEPHIIVWGEGQGPDSQGLTSFSQKDINEGRIRFSVAEKAKPGAKVVQIVNVNRNPIDEVDGVSTSMKVDKQMNLMSTVDTGITITPGDSSTDGPFTGIIITPGDGDSSVVGPVRRRSKLIDRIASSKIMPYIERVKPLADYIRQHRTPDSSPTPKPPGA